MKHTSALIFIFVIILLPVFCSGEEPTTENYLRNVSVFSPAAAKSVEDILQEARHPEAAAASQFDPFSYIPHGWLSVPAGTRLMVFVPHPDDETLGAAGLIQRVIEGEGKVRVVFVTNGDGYTYAVRLRVKNATVTGKDFIEYGKKRQEEAVQALCELGVQPEEAVFLGFPDDGIDDLWESYWSNVQPFISPHTLFDRPHRKGLKRWVKYSGVSLRDEIERVIKEFSPDWVVLPDPRDCHPDHAAAGVFVLDALETLYYNDDTIPAKVLTYLVHYKDYPQARQWSGEISGTGVGGFGKISGKTLADTSWLSLPLSAEEVEGKRRALLAHGSQLQMLQWFFRNFLLPSEMYGSLTLTQVITVPLEYAAYYKHLATIDEAAEKIEANQ
ncbi:MAG TPA: PIG-L family deacetylase [Syntrophobacteraceae bacterium]|nr:PIG-L family deacetylase [Syntrophobacteraceae bacterium]